MFDLQMRLEALGLTGHGVRVEIRSDTASMTVGLSRESAVNHAVRVLHLAGVTRVSIRPDGSYRAEA